ncbi:hypothetical protein B0H17DRAFT_1068552 [Mycena rosella]|uniref:EH domain-containing protein n=1 Tax=Mycena rosella TaxID=1033263 RepID=A0AAD7DD14_MYCRO|nr:hypothetical protein B0H17DRAFT_1068552 [Mycena rosella]
MPSLISASSMAPNFAPSTSESAVVARLFARGEPHKLGVLTGDVALDLFSKTNLSVQVLSDIWTIADKDGHGWLSPTQAAVAVRLIGWAQAGTKPTPELLEKPGPLADIPDVPRAGPSKIASSVIPPFAPEDKIKFQRLFLNSGPVSGISVRAREIFSKSHLPAEKLAQIWELSDTQHRGALDSTDFAIAMHLIQGLMNNQFSILPVHLPNELYERAAAEPSSPSIIVPSSPSVIPSNSNSHRLTVQTDLKRSGSSSSSRHSDEQVKSSGWDIPSGIKAIADRQFDALDPLKNGFIHDNISLPFLLESKLPPDELARIWTLADVNSDGKLTRDGFAIALFLIEERRRGNPLPASLPSSLKPPDMPNRPSGIERHSQYVPEKTVNAQFPPNGNLQPPDTPTQSQFLPETVNGGLSPNENLQRRPSRFLYPSLSSQPNNIRFLLYAFPALPALPTTPHDAAVAHLACQSHVEKATAIANLTQENVSLRVMVEELQIQATNDDPESQNVVNQVLMEETLKQVQASSSDVEMQRIQYEDLVRENERLHKQVTEMRESTTQLPWSGGDSELQTLINEDLARENARLRTEARETQETVSQLQEATSGYDEQRRLNAELVRDNERLQESARTLRTRFDAQRREASQLSREVDRLKTQLRANASAAASGSQDADIPPPAYDEVDLSQIT